MYLASDEPSEGGFWTWWFAGLLFMIPGLLAWAAAAVTGYVMAGVRSP